MDACLNHADVVALKPTTATDSEGRDRSRQPPRPKTNKIQQRREVHFIRRGGAAAAIDSVGLVAGVPHRHGLFVHALAATCALAV